MDTLNFVFGVLMAAIVVWLLSKAVFSAYFTAREDHLDRLITKWKDKINGKAK